MNIRKFCRLGFLTLTSLFWASCGTDSNPQFPSMAANPDSSADNSGSSSSVEPASSSSADVESSSDVAQPSSSTDNLASSSAEAPVSSANVASSSSVASSASASGWRRQCYRRYILCSSIVSADIQYSTSFPIQTASCPYCWLPRPSSRRSLQVAACHTGPRTEHTPF